MSFSTVPFSSAPFSSAGRTIISGAASISTSAAVSVEGTIRVNGAASISGSISVTSVTATVMVFAAASITTSSSVGVGATIRKAGRASVSGSISTSTSAVMKRFNSSSITASIAISAEGVLSGEKYGATSLLASASVLVAGKIERFADTEEFIVYINTDIGKIASINTAKSFEG